MDKRGGAIFDLMMIGLVIIGITALLLIVINLIDTKTEIGIEPYCKKSCVLYDMTFYKIETGVYEQDKCWCYEESGLPRQVPIEYGDEGFTTKLWEWFQKS